MKFGTESKNISVIQAQYEAQKIAFSPFVFQASVALRDLKILSTIMDAGKSGISFNALKEKLKLSDYAMRVLLEAGQASAIIYEEEEKYHLTKVGYFLDNDEMTKVNMNFTRDVCYDGLSKLTESIEVEKPEGLSCFGNWNTIYEGLTALPERAQQSWYDFDHFYSDLSYDVILPIVFSEKPKTLMDAGSNTGKFSLKCLVYDKNIRVTLLDHAIQLEKASANIKTAGYSDRAQLVSFDFLKSEEMPKGQDVIWMSQFLDCFSEEQVMSILCRAKRALNPNGKLFILETCWDRQKYEGASFSIIQTSLYFTALANGNSKMFGSDRLTKCIEESGFKVSEETNHVGGYHTLFCCKPVL